MAAAFTIFRISESTLAGSKSCQGISVSVQCRLRARVCCMASVRTDYEYLGRFGWLAQALDPDPGSVDRAFERGKLGFCHRDLVLGCHPLGIVLGIAEIVTGISQLALDG